MHMTIESFLLEHHAYYMTHGHGSLILSTMHYDRVPSVCVCVSGPNGFTCSGVADGVIMVLGRVHKNGLCGADIY